MQLSEKKILEAHEKIIANKGDCVKSLYEKNYLSCFDCPKDAIVGDGSCDKHVDLLIPKFHEWNFRTSKEWMDKHNKEAAKNERN